MTRLVTIYMFPHRRLPGGMSIKWLDEGREKTWGGKKHARRCARHGPVRSKVLPALHLERRPDIVLSEGSGRLLNRD